MLKRLLIAFVSCVDRTMIYVCNLLHDKQATGHLPSDLIQEIAWCLLPDVVAYCESEEGKAEFAKWQQEQEKSKA
ncbi:MAG: hypothetical protein IIU86_01505 [Oscillospiraceae bacterium]|nr:hypothetical protein [Oscillospiraceae bacterium]